MRRVLALAAVLCAALSLGVTAAYAIADEYAGPKLWTLGDEAQGSYSTSWYEDDFAKPSSGYQTWSGFKRATDYGLQGTSNSNQVTVYQWFSSTNKAGHCIYQSTSG